MPTYEYECLKCKKRFDRFQSIKDEPIAHCEKCGGKVRRVIGAAGVIFRGSGFYRTDYKNKGNGKPAQSEEKTQDMPAKCSSCAESANCPASQEK